MPREPKPRGRPTKRSPEVEQRILAGLSKGTPLTVICLGDDMPDDRTVRDWQASDPEFSAAIARAREAGFDQIALDALAIADDTENDTVQTKEGEKPNTEWISRSRLRVDTRLKLLAKWDPKRYGELLKLGNPDGTSLDLADRLTKARERAANIDHGE